MVTQFIQKNDNFFSHPYSMGRTFENSKISSDFFVDTSLNAPKIIFVKI